jgi:hypothetical protein
MWIEFVVGFLGSLGGVGVAVLALKGLIGRFIDIQVGKALAEHKHVLDIDLARLQGEMSRLGAVLNRRDERQFTVIGEAWKHLSVVCQLAPQLTFSNEIKRNCEQEWIGLRDCLDHGEIFVAADIYEALDDLRMDLQIVFNDPPERLPELVEFTRKLDAVRKKKLLLAETIRSRFGFVDTVGLVQADQEPVLAKVSP